MSAKSPVNITRRHLLGTALGGAAFLAAGRSFAAGKTLNVLSHKVHQTVLGTGDGDLLKDWRSANDADITWSTFDSNPLQDRLFREASLNATEFNVGFMVDNRPTSQIAAMFEPLDDYLKKEPIEAFDDIAPGLVQGMTVDGKLIGIPVRHATQGLFYNEALLEEQGITAPPKTLEELVEQAQKLTFTSKNGTRVTGMVLASDLAVFPVMFARAFGGDFLTKKFELVPDPAAMEKGLTVLRNMFESGALPRSYATTKNDDQVTWLQQGRAAFTVLPFARFAQLNNPEQSKFPGKIKAIEFPVSAALQGKTPMASVVEAWGMVIPANSRDKDLSWKFIREVSSKRVTLGMANNGNGPVRVSTYKDKSFADKNPVAAVEAAALANARGAFPPFPEAARAQSIFLEEVQLAVLGRKPVNEAVASISSRIKPLLPPA
ncbi:ABC transporter substrate-binding protein [Microvirga subterranea]|uniref:Carbohydrate ABC transporter substrate-binding protein (CUT1 family) n=1 Tax=Microvirga subterranea TaxID=186651 RepID=A0A370HGT5_9HYPH|nr:extracellular solute-binding protein [Microvirga subterranea]RDI56394.1 carbohydrate ABC transporter substrate-binding protein (CUT1 family) [Microvirga subterranea]